jgi:DNA-binding helix-hairpin-helix protein with protein kinase domain
MKDRPGPGTIVMDQHNFAHQIGKMLGKGGQGAVFTTGDPNVVIKALVDPVYGSIRRDEQEYDAFAAAIDEVRILDLPKELHIARPVHLLKRPYCGYIMRMMSDMEPIANLTNSPKGVGLKEFYLQHGGLRRRLQLLAEAARVLARLHGLPVVYGDISPANLFVSKRTDAREVWFIDSDNMRYTVDFGKKIHTPGYGAPEIVTGQRSNNTQSDIYSFAILAFEVLALLSPFEGELVTEGGGWDSDVNYTELAKKGQVPWVEDAEDDSNRSPAGIPRANVLSERLYELFQQTLGREGRANPASRPSLWRWYEVLRQAADATVACQHCGHTFYFGPDPVKNGCPFCGKPRAKICLARVLDAFRDPEGDSTVHVTPRLTKVFDVAEKPDYLYAYHTEVSLSDTPLEPRLEVRLGRGQASVWNLTGQEFTVEHGGREYRLAHDRIYDAESLEGLRIRIRVHEHRSRYIAFYMI